MVRIVRSSKTEFLVKYTVTPDIGASHSPSCSYVFAKNFMIFISVERRDPVPMK